MILILYGIIATSLTLLARRSRLLSARSGIALFLFPLLFTGRALLTGRVYAPIDLPFIAEPMASTARSVGVTSIATPALSDVSAQFIPWNAALRASIAHRQWPLWNPFELGGNVLAGAAQSAPYHPVTLLALLLPAPDAMTFMAAMTYFLAALSAFLFLRTLCTSELAALFGAAGWCFSNHIVSFILTAHGAAMAVFPLVLFGVHQLIEHRSVRSFSLLVAAMTLTTLCGHPETLVHVASLTIAYTLVAARKDLATVFGAVGGAGVVTLLLTAVFIVPLLDAIPQTREYVDRVRHDAARNQNSWPVVLHLLASDVVPFAEGEAGVESRHHSPDLRHQWAGTAYCGAILFAPALLAFWRSPSRMTWFFAAVVVVCLFVGAEAPGVSDLLQHVPLFSLAVNARMIAFAAFGICVLASIGLQKWLEAPAPMGFLQVAVAAIIALVSLTLVANGLSPAFVRVAAAREVLPLLLAFACLRVSRSPSMAAALLIALLLFQRTTEIGGLVPTLDRRAFFPPLPGMELLQRDRSPFRIVGQDVLLTPNTAAEYGLEDVRGYNAMNLGRLAETFPLWSVPQPVWSNRVDDLSRPFLSLMNVRYAFVPPGASIPARWHPLATFQNYRILENDAVLPRAFVPGMVHVGSDRHTLQEMAACKDFGSEAWIETAGPAGTQANGSGNVSVRADGSQLLLHASMDAPGWVVLSQSAWKGWRVLRGGQPLKIHFADHSFIAVYLPRGEHELVAEYWPRSFVAGAAATLATILGLIAAALIRPLALGSWSWPRIAEWARRSPARP